MPELPEVETVARDLRGLVVGARISGVRVSWLKTLRSQDPEAFARAVVGREIVGTSRRAKLVVLELDDRERDHDPPQDDRPAVRAPAAAVPTIPTSGSCWSSRTGGSCGSAISASSDASGSPGGTRSRATWRASSAGRRGSRASGRSRSMRRSRARVFREADPGAQGPAEAAAARPGVRRRRRQHLRGRGAVGVAAPPAPVRWRRCGPRTRAGCTASSSASSPRPSRSAGSSVDDYTAPEGDGEMQERLLVYQRAGRALPPVRASDPAHRHRCALDALLLVVPAAARRRARGCRCDPARDGAEAGAST